MRAVCEVCQAPQPVDWKPGDSCINCGQQVRRDLRCFWCVKWTPGSGKFCRSCGAAVVDARRFGAARMLKAAGVDRFGVPKMLAELDPDQVENFERIYEHHDGVLNRHLDHVRFLESFLQSKSWSEKVEEELLPELPWPDDRLKALSPPIDPLEQGLSRSLSRAEARSLAQALEKLTPLPLTGALAVVVRLLLEDWDAQKDCESVVHWNDPRLKGEAAIALTNWRVIYVPGLQSDRYQLMTALRECPFQLPAAVQLAMLGDKETEVPGDALESADPDIAFTAALAAGDIARLAAAERDSDPLKRFVAAYQLIHLGNLAGVGEVVRAAEPELQLRLLKKIHLRKKSAPEVRDVLFDLMETAEDGELRRYAADVALFDWHPGDTMRIARAARGDSQVYQALLQTKTISPEELASLCEFLLEQGAFKAGQWGMSDAAKAGRVPADFVPRHWLGAAESARVEMCKFAEMQLLEYADDGLHKFLGVVVFGDESFAVQQQAWVSLFRWYKRLDPSGDGALKLQAESLRQFFSSVRNFLPIFSRFLGSGAPGPILQDLFVRDPLEKLIRYASPDLLPDLTSNPRPALDLAQAMRGVMANPQCEFTLRLACIQFLAMLTQAGSLREPVIKILESFQGTDLDHGVSTALAQIEAKPAVL